MVVAEKADFQSAMGDSLKAFFMQSQMWLNQFEPLFTLVNITPTAFNQSEMFKHMRNMIILQRSSENTGDSTHFTIRRDVWSSNQVVAEFTITDKNKFFPLFKEKQKLIMGAFYTAERIRMKRVFKSTENVKISELLMKKFGFRLTCPDGFRITVNKPEVVALNLEAKDYGQNILISTYPYTAESFKQSDILKHRNTIAQKYVQGSIDSSYMTTETLLPPESREVNFAGMYAIETRGLWKLVGDFMGGPFQNYVFLNKETGNIVMIDVFLYSPRKPKRDLMMQLEGIAYSIDFAKREITKATKP